MACQVVFCPTSRFAFWMPGLGSSNRYDGVWRHPLQGRSDDSGYWKFLEKSVKEVSQNCNFMVRSADLGTRMRKPDGCAAFDALSTQNRESQRHKVPELMTDRPGQHQLSQAEPRWQLPWHGRRAGRGANRPVRASSGPA